MLKQRMFGMMFNDWMRVVDYKVNNSTKECIGDYYAQDMDEYELWYCEHEDEEHIACAESGDDREYEFDFDEHMEALYEESLGNTLP